MKKHEMEFNNCLGALRKNIEYLIGMERQSGSMEVISPLYVSRMLNVPLEEVEACMREMEQDNKPITPTCAKSARKLEVLDRQLIDATSGKAKNSPRLRMNYNFHPELSDKVQRFINCMEPGTQVEFHHHPVDEMLVVIRGAIKTILVDDKKNVIDEKVIRPANGVYGVQLPANVWHTIECLEPNTCVFEVKEGPFVPHAEGGILK